MTPYQLFTILRARWLTALTILLVTLGVAIGYIMLTPRSYTARAPVLVNVPSAEIGGGYSPALLTSYMATQIDVARSDRVAERVLDALKADPPQAMRDAKLADSPEGQRREHLRALQGNLSVKPARESNIINIAWTGSTAAEAARVANLFASVFAETVLDLKTNPAKQESVWFDQQVSAARQKLEQAQAKLTDFQQRTGIVGEDMSDHEMARLTTLATQLAQVQAFNTDAQSRRGVQRETVADVMQSPLVNGLKADVARLEGQLQQSAATLGPRHPQMQRLEAELASTRSRLAAESRTIVTSIDTSFQAGRAREQELLAQLNAQRGRVLAVGKDRGLMTLLRQDVQVAQQAYAQVTDNAAKVRLQSVVTATNVRPLNPAAEPSDPNGPSRKLALLVAGVAGLALAFVGALLLELLNRRVRSIDDVIMATQLPVLASVPTSGNAYAALPGTRRRLALAHGSAA